MNPEIKILYHGTASYNLEQFKETTPIAYPRSYLPRCKRAFCTSQSFDEAAFFAFRKTPINNLSDIGIVLEYNASCLSLSDYVLTRDSIAIRNEQEVAVLNTKKLKLVAYHKYINGIWERKEI